MNQSGNDSDKKPVKMWRNPSTGKLTKIPAKKVMKFKAVDAAKGTKNILKAKGIKSAPEKTAPMK